MPWNALFLFSLLSPKTWRGQSWKPVPSYGLKKVDRIYYALAHHEDSAERAKKEKVKLQEAQKHHESPGAAAKKELVKYLRRSLPLDTNLKEKINGRNYQFTVSKRKELAVEIKTDPQLWEPSEQESFCIQQEVCVTKHTVVRSMSGEVLEERTEPKTTTEILPNLDAIRDAHANGQQLPDGVKVIQEFSIRTRRLVSNELEVRHPNISGNLYQKLEAPTDLSDAQIKIRCYQQTMKDIELQIEANELETSMLCNGDDILAGNADKVEELEAKKLKLLNSKQSTRTLLTATELDCSARN